MWGGVECFKQYEDYNIKIILDTSFAAPYLLREQSSKSLLSRGYINQEIAKLTFFKSKISWHYLCLDSDTIFIRDFVKSDFFYDYNTPYITLVSDKELLSKPYYINFARERTKFVERIFRELNLYDSRLRTCHNSQIISYVVMESFHNEVIQQKGISYSDLIEISPFEFSWYNAYFQKCKIIPEVQVEPFFKMYHTRAEYVLDKLVGQSVDNLRTQYFGYILNSNWASPSLAQNPFKKQSFFMRLFWKILSRIL